MTNEDRVSRPWNWPREWWYDEKFWREVTTRTIAGVLAALIVLLLSYLTALILGIFKLPSARQIISVVLLVAAVPLVLMGLVRIVLVFARGVGNVTWKYIFTTLSMSALGSLLAAISTYIARI
ncbi:hypothetical protein GTU73_09455 [Rathayibacter sp. VKM Ac-2804]|uniref:hypothetical protein n=1 Tax=Rathayibacter sp. VKM Ac-2804 TaxID=2609257 RepID=UPI00132ECCCA|nr:hypothetical protein [Rathayibacter sp. VKM Ac-2804]QHF24215.1 hypothetical protein GTU73_09455 [Rathayibacter sp. VKM Ac-2804]